MLTQPIGITSFTVGGVVVLAALLHAGWNALAHSVRDQFAALTFIGLTSMVVAGGVLLVAPPPGRAAALVLACSVLVHACYNLLLFAAYRQGNFNQAYPLARGSSPLLVAAFGVGVLGERPGTTALIGIAVIAAGLGVLALPGPGRAASSRRAVLLALATGCAIAAYTVLDGVGVRRADSTLGYTAWLFFLQGILISAFALVMRRGRLRRTLRGSLRVGLAGGLLSLVAYGLVLWAQTRADLGTVAALRETSVIFGALLGRWLFREPFGLLRTVATVVVVAGIGLLVA